VSDEKAMTDEKDRVDQPEPEAKARPRKVARSVSTSGRATFEPGSPEAAEEGPNVRKWDMRADRPAPSATSPGSGRPRGPRRPFDAYPGDRRPGASGGRATPFIARGPVDKASPEFVDRWLSSPPRKPEDRPDRPGRKDRRPPKDGARRGPSTPPPAKRAPAPAPAASQPKLPTLHETILVGLPKVATQRKDDKIAQKPRTAKEALAAKAAASQKPKVEPARGEVLVDPSWVSGGPDRAVALLKEAGPAAEALVDAWLHANNVAAIAEAAVSEELSGPARKASRRALGVLKARGVALPERQAPAPAVRPTEEEVVEATFTPPDGRGAFSMTITKRRGGERAHIAEVIVREGVGIVNAVSGWMSRSQIKEAHQRITDSTGVPPAAVPPEWVRFRIAEAKADNAKSGQLVPLGLDGCKDLLGPLPAEPPPHPIADLEAALGDDEGAAPASLHAEPEFRAWLPDAQAMDEMLRKVGEKLTPEDAADAKKVDEVLKEEIKMATDRYFTPEQRAVVARRMRDAAITVRERSGVERATDVLRAVRAIERAGLITSPPSDLEFLRVFFQKALSLLAQQQGGQVRVPVAAG
jgi:hypothetical protein